MATTFRKFENIELDDFGAHRIVKTIIECDAETFKEIEKALKPLGIIFRSPSR
jgi:hypothetical protein